MITATAPSSTMYQPAPAGGPDGVPRVFAAIAAVMADAMPVGKNQQNQQQNYKFRGIDDVMSAMAGPMRRHGLFIVPELAHHEQQRDGKMTRVLIKMRYPSTAQPVTASSPTSPEKHPTSPTRPRTRPSLPR